MSNPFKIGDTVKTTTGSIRTGGKVKHIACSSATQAGGRTCDRKQCYHTVREYVWVEWTDGSVCSYKYTDLAADTSPVSKDTKLEELKKIVKENYDKIKDKEKPIDFKRYNGFTKVKVDKQGRPYLQESTQSESAIPPIQEKELDWNAYMGYKRGPYRLQEKDKSG